MAAIPAVAPKVGRHLRAFYACLYFGGLRPSEAVDLRLGDCTLPATGWGKLTLAGSAPAAGRKWTDSGKLRDDRGLKHRAEGATRPVPIPPELVAMLRAHVAEFGVAEDGRLFRSQRGNRLAPVSYEDRWTRARERVLSPAQVASPWRGLRTTFGTLVCPCGSMGAFLRRDVAERAGHSVKMLLSTFAHCIDGGEDEINKRIDAAPGSPSARSTEHAERRTPRPTPSGTRVPRAFRD